MPMTKSAIKSLVLKILEDGPVLQKDLFRYPPLDTVYDPGPAVRELVQQGRITREKKGASYLLTKKEP